MSNYANLQFHLVEFLSPGVLHVQLHRPKVLNAMHKGAYLEYGRIFTEAENDPKVRVIILSGSGKNFTVGLDIGGVDPLLFQKADTGRQGINLLKEVAEFQDNIGKVHTINKPVIGVAHGYCIGLALDILSGVDIRYASKDATFSIREAGIGMTADIGTLQRLPKVVNNLGWLKEATYTARDFGADEAQQQGVVNDVFETKQDALAAALKIAENIAAKSPVAIWGSKKSINYAIDHSIPDSLDQIAHYNGFALSDLIVGANAARSKQKPKYKDLLSKL